MAVNKRLLQGAAAAPGGITPSEHFGVVLYEGDGASSHSINGGKFGAAAYFDGSNGKIDIDRNVLVGDDWTISMWVRVASGTPYTNFRFFDSSYGDYAGKLRLGINTDGTVNVAQGNSTSAETSFSSTGTINDNAWHNLSVTFDGTTARLYIDGSADGTGTPSNYSDSSGDARIGGGNTISGSNPFKPCKGKIDQVRIFSKTLSSSEVSTLYAETTSTVTSLEPLGNETVDTLQVLGDSSCTSLYRFENNEDDESGNYDATGTQIQYAAGRYGQAVELGARGNNSYVDMTTATTPTTSTLSLWFKTSHNNSDWTLIVDGGGSRSSDTGYAIFRSGDGGYINLYFTDSDTGNSQLFTGNINITDDIWHHIVLSMASDNTFVLYLDGSSHLSGTRTKWTSGDTHSVSTVRFGNSSTVAANSGNQFYGEIDQVRTFNKALSASEATTLYEENSLVASYRFEGNANDDTRNNDGTASNVTYEYGLGFTPDFVWIKERSAAESHRLFDTTRGATERLFSDNQNAQSTATDSLTSFDTGGFTVGSSAAVNQDGEDYVAWCWKANGGTTTSGTGTGGVSSVTHQLNSDAGFCITKFTSGSSAGGTVTHGLDSAPDLIFMKATSSTQAWWVWSSTFADGNQYLQLQSEAAQGSSSNVWNSTAPSASVVTLGAWNSQSFDYIMYAFKSIDNFSKFGSYVGNGSSDGPIIETGFEPAFLMIKRTDTDPTGGAGHMWVMYDNLRSPSNPRKIRLWADGNPAEATYTQYSIDFLSNGFQLKDGSSGFAQNTNGGNYIYMAFAADPDTEAPAVAKSFNAVVYSGNLSSDGPILDIGFNPGLVWIKAIETTSTGDKSHRLHDVVRGQQSFLKSDTTDAASSSGDRLNFNYSDTQIQIINASKGWNDNGYRYVSWVWKADDNEPTIIGGPAKVVYKFEDNSNDVTGNNNGTDTNITYTSSGKFNKAAVFNGSSAYIDIGDNKFKDSKFSISTWVYVTSTVNGQTIYNGYDEQPNEAAGTLIRLDSNNKVQVNGWNPPSTYGGEVKSNSSLSLNTWHHIIVTLRQGNVNIYIDGDLDKSGTISSFGYHSTHNFIIGAHKKTGQSASNFFNGRLDQFRYYTGVISDLGAAALYAETASNNNDLTLGAPKETIISANANAGFSIVKWEGTGTQTEIPHGLSAVPEMIISKRLDSTNNWSVYHKDLDLSHTTYPNWLYLNLTSAEQNSSSSANHPYYARPSATVIYQNTGTSESTNVDGGEYISYCFHSVSGFSKFGSYSGSSSAVTVTTGFRPDFVLIKNKDAVRRWPIFDSVRNNYGSYLDASDSLAEQTDSTIEISTTSTGFVLPAGANYTINNNGYDYIYMAFKIN